MSEKIRNSVKVRNEKLCAKEKSVSTSSNGWLLDVMIDIMI